MANTTSGDPVSTTPVPNSNQNQQSGDPSVNQQIPAPPGTPGSVISASSTSSVPSETVEEKKGGTLSDLAKKISSWKEGVVGDADSSAPNSSDSPASTPSVDGPIQKPVQKPMVGSPATLPLDSKDLAGKDQGSSSGLSPATVTVSDDSKSSIPMGMLQDSSKTVEPSFPPSAPDAAPDVTSDDTPDAISDLPSTTMSGTNMLNSVPTQPPAKLSIDVPEDKRVPGDVSEQSNDIPLPAEAVKVDLPDISKEPDSSALPTATPLSSVTPKPVATGSPPSSDPSTVNALEGNDSILKETPPPAQLPAATAVKSRPGEKYPYTIDDLMQLVVEKEASDLHITVDYPAMIRVDGSLLPVGQELVDESMVSELILPVLPENKRELLEVNREVDLAYTFKEDARFRINAFYTKGNISAAFRLIPNKIRSIEDLKVPGIHHQLVKLPQGLVLVTGPTGHGKSTTLAAMLQEVNETYPKHIITFEDPIEYIYPRALALVDQREMHEDTHSWEIALRSAMREDPDVVLVGEMRDFETISAAITLAETGHLVFATLHTNSAAQTIDRMIDVFPEHQQEQVRTQLSMILEAVIAQRLIPLKTGGRRAVSEVLLATGAVRNLIREGKTHQLDNVIRTSLDVGMKTLEHSLVDLVREGVISVDEAENVAVHPEEVSRLMRM